MSRRTRHTAKVLTERRRQYGQLRRGTLGTTRPGSRNSHKSLSLGKKRK